MNNAIIQDAIEQNFRKQVQKNKKVKSAFLLVHSEKLNLHLNIAEGMHNGKPAHPKQPNHMASVGKLFTATLISILYEQGKLEFDDKISRYLDEELMAGLHFYKGRDYSGDIMIKHLLMQTSGLNDVFYHLWKKMTKDPAFHTTPRDAILWGKENLKPVSIPGKKHFYTDTNYYLLGLIIENITSMSFSDAMHRLIFEPLEMNNAYMFGFSKPKYEPEYPPARLYIQNVDLMAREGIHQIDYAGGSVIAPMEDYLIFIKSLFGNKIIKKETLERMINDDIYMGFPTLGFDYGYSIWKLKSFPLLMPKEYYSRGCVGVTGAYMFHHPLTESFIIGTFNDFSYRGKALQFMAKKVIKELLKINGK